MSSTTSAEFFDSIYRTSDDPWKFATSDYEQQRYAAMSKAIGHRRYVRAFEPGCSVGVFTTQLARLCDVVVANDISEIAVERAQERCRKLPNVSVQRGDLLHCLPTGDFDLIVLSEIGYYFSKDELRLLLESLTLQLQESGVLLATHWLGYSEDHVLSGDEVHGVLADSQELVLEHAEIHPLFRLDRWRKT